MAKGLDQLPSVQGVKHTYAPEQILAAFNIPIDDSNKCLCPFHDETLPSMQVNEDYVFCYGCGTSADSYELAKHLLSKKAGKKVSQSAVLTFFKDNHLPLKTKRAYRSSVYKGAVPANLIEYWTNHMTDVQFDTLLQERLITKETALKYKLGWRPDYEAWSIPFFRGELGTSPVDIVQFRLTNSDKKYIGLAGHTRGSVMNAHLLETTQDYIVIFFGSFDSILALQDGVTAVGLNGCNPFRKTEKERVKQLFSKQHTIFIVPDNTESEYKGAEELAKWLNGHVRYFDKDLPNGCDYIDYRKLGKSSLDFLQDVLKIEPITSPDPEMMENLYSLLEVGDKYALASVHLANAVDGQVVQDVARLLAKHAPFGRFTANQWATIKPKLWAAKSQIELCSVLDTISKEAQLLKTSAW